nr:hypothetical protein [Kitasatospora sp. NA04385]
MDRDRGRHRQGRRRRSAGPTPAERVAGCPARPGTGRPPPSGTPKPSGSCSSKRGRPV